MRYRDTGARVHTAETLHSKELLCASEKGLLFSQGEGRRYPTNICQDKDCCS